MVSTATAAVLLLAWTLLLPDLTGEVDRWWPLSPTDQTSGIGQVAAAISLVTAPVVVFAGLLLTAWWAKSRRLNAIAGAILLASALTWSTVTLIKAGVDRARPASPWDFLITQQDGSYPSGHAAAATTAAILVVALFGTLGFRRATLWWGRLIGAAAVVLVCLDRLVLHAHHVSDVIGGVLLGTFSTSLALLICDVHTTQSRAAESDGRAAVIYNPAKIPDPTTFMRLVDTAVADLGWDPPLWLATSPSDPGHAMAAAAKEAGVDLVMVAGGDGTVRVVCGELAGSGIRLAIIPAGTGNLLARNLEIPLDYARALRVIADGEVKPLDVVRFTNEDKPDAVEYSVVMAGVGADAAIMQDTDERLKKQIGSLAYFAAGVNHIRTAPFTARLHIDGGEPEPIEASLISIGNVGDLQGGLTVIPEASASDGLMDVMVASPTNQAEIAQMLAAVLARPDEIPHLSRHTAKVVELVFDEPTLFQIDGDVIGETRHLKAEMLHHAIELMLPPRENPFLS